ncbi:MAG: hypothetical protein ABI175_00080, partial [Polyangiales bacterium]
MYAFVAVLSIAIMIALLVLPRYARSPKYLEAHAAVVQYIIERSSLKEPKQFGEIMNRFEARIRGRLTLFDAKGTMVRTNVDPPLEAPTADERETLQTEKWALESGRIVLRSDDHSLLAVYSPNRPGFPWFYVLPLGA